MTTTLLAKGSSGLHCRAQRFQTLFLNPKFDVSFSKKQNGSCLTCNQSLQRLCGGNIVQSDSNTKRNVVVYSSVQPEQPLPSKPNSNAWKSWTVGIFLSVVLPFSSNKWGPLLKIKNEVETTLQTTEDIVETVEKATERVEKMAEDVIDDLPDGGKLKCVMIFIEKLAETAAKRAHSVDNVIDKVQEMGEQVEKYLESAKEETKEDGKEAKE